MSRYYTLLRDPARRRIVEILGNQGKIGFKEARTRAGGHMEAIPTLPILWQQNLEHDPLISVEYSLHSFHRSWVMILVVASGAMGVALAVAKWKRKIVNIVGAH